MIRCENSNDKFEVHAVYRSMIFALGTKTHPPVLGEHDTSIDELAFIFCRHKLKPEAIFKIDP